MFTDQQSNNRSIHPTYQGEINGQKCLRRKKRTNHDAWGNVLTATGNLADVNPLRYRGYYFDTETGFYYLQSRYYDPIVKRFLNADAYGSTGQGFLGYNMFAYCNNKPVISVDPTGETFVNAVEDQIPDVGGVCISLGLLGWISSLFLGNDVVVTDRVSSPAASSPSVSSQSNIVVEGASSAGPHSLSSVQIQANSVQAVSPKKPINLPSTKKVKIDMAHILSGHSAGGNRGPNKDRFPPWMTAKMIEQAIRMAYNNAEKGGPLQLSWQDGEEIIRQFYKGPWTEGTIEFWFNYSKKTIETAWPK